MLAAADARDFEFWQAALEAAIQLRTAAVRTWPEREELEPLHVEPSLQPAPEPSPWWGSEPEVLSASVGNMAEAGVKAMDMPDKMLSSMPDIAQAIERAKAVVAAGNEAHGDAAACAAVAMTWVGVLNDMHLLIDHGCAPFSWLTTCRDVARTAWPTPFCVLFCCAGCHGV